jgi:prepilin-type N-terminal cleavage/methylation domain-containing protein
MLSVLRKRSERKTYRSAAALRVTREGFTLIELLLVIGIIAILMGIMIGALSPTRQLGFARDAKRQSDVNTILNAVYQYAIDHNGGVPGSIPLSNTAIEICRTGIPVCIGGADLDLLSGSYLVSVPVDPRAPDSGTGTSYFIKRDNNGRLTVKAPLAEVRNVIEVTR